MGGREGRDLKKEEGSRNWVKFLGTAGARFVVARQLRSSAGLWLSVRGTRVVIDPGPGTLVRCLSSRPKLLPETLDGIVLTHKHIDHSNDVNIMVEAMTDGGWKRRGVLFCPRDALEGDPVVLQYLREFPERIEVLQPESRYTVRDVSFFTTKKLLHPVETYGLRFEGGEVALLPDTRFFPELPALFQGTGVLIINIVRREFREGLQIDHLNLRDAARVIGEVRPRLAVLTHFGMTMIKGKPWELAGKLEKETGIEVKAAQDGMILNLS